MILFNNDYSEGAHPKVLERLCGTNMEQSAGYGEDKYCAGAAALIREMCLKPDAAVHFLVGGTQTNLTFISSALRPHQGAISAATGHINTHETGAIEASGHKVLAVPSCDGKLTAEAIRTVCQNHFRDEAREHTVQPKLVYITNPTEIGTIYSREELASVSSVCRENGLILYMDGARLGSALRAKGADLDLPELAGLCDAFYIGGTKGGALFGEALVICSEGLKTDFRYILKQKGGLLAKGRLLGLQFLALLEDGLYFELAEHANKMAAIIKEMCAAKGCRFISDSFTNQQFPIMPDSAVDRLKEKYGFEFWEKTDESHSAVRFCTSWATREEDVRELTRDISRSM